MSSFSLFGQQPQQPQQQQSGIFGQPATQQPQQQGSIFGQQTAQQPQLQSSPFGSNAQQQQGTGGSLFGAQQPQQQGSIFGQPTTQPQQQQGSIFGQSTAQQPQQQGTGGSLFGAQQQQQQQGPNFGKPALTLFQPLQPGGNTFGGGQTAQQNPGGSLFGGAQQNTGGGGGGGLFGGQQQPQQQQQQQQGGLFGQSTQQGGGVFGGQQQPGGTSLFGNTQSGGGGPWNSLQPQQGGGIFGQPQSQMGGLAAFGQQSQNSMMMQSSQMQQQSSNLVVDKLRRINNAWDPGHPDYAFKYYLYNHVGEDRANLYQKPPADDLAEWEKAWTERPSKGSVPVIAKGFKDLDSRVKTQEQQVNLFRHRLHEIQDKLTALQNRHDLVTSIKLEDCRRRHTALSRRALSLASKVQVLKNRGYALQPEEELLKKRLEGLARAVWDPAVRGRVNEIWARMMVVGEQARVMEENAGKVEIVWDEKQLHTAAKLLQSNAAGLEHLTKEVKEIEKALAEWEEEQKLRPQGF